MSTGGFGLFLACQPGLEPVLAEEASDLGFADPVAVPGGVETQGDWPEVWRANLCLRGAGRVLVRIGAFRAFHLAQLDKRARKFPWGDVLRADVPVRVETTCRASRIYHAGAATQRIERALQEELGATLAPDGVLVRARIEDDLVTLSRDSSGEPLHRRGHKEAVGKAPMRETLAALFLRQCGYTGAEPVVDPMCGSGTFVIEAAEIASGLPPGRSRAFAFEQFAGFDPKRWARMRATSGHAPGAAFFGSDRDQGAIRMATENAARSGISATTFLCQPASALVPPDGPPGLVMVNPPYGARIGNKNMLYGLYANLGAVLKERFAGWRVGLVTSEAGLARATTLPLNPAGPPVPHGGLKITLWRAGPL